jgi:CubicO group peptidase (beta-lactamase class C family)
MTIDQKYAQLGGANGFLGAAASAETVCPDQVGHFRHYQHGSIYWHPSTDAHEIHGAIRDLWSSLGWELSWLGYPTSDEGPEAGGGRVSIFQNGYIDWSAAKGAVDRAHLEFRAYHGSSLAQHKQCYQTLKAGGWRMTALTIYGNSPLYAAVWVKKDGPDWTAIHNATADQYQAFVNEWFGKGYRITLVAATGSGSKPTFAAVVEKTTRATPLARHGLTPAEFKSWCAWAASDGWMLTTAGIYGDSGDPRLAAVWDLNTDNTGWNADSLLESFDQTQTIFNAQVEHESRLYEMIPSAYNSWLALYRGDWVGPGHAYTALSADDYQNAFDHRVAQGYFPASIHAAGDSDGDAVFSAIFTKRESPLPKRWVATGAAVPSLALFDEQMQGYMQRHNIRAGSLAIAKGSKLVYARGFTWAEPGYPITQPTDMFRVGSCSKLLTSILIHRLVQDNQLSYGDTAVAKLGLTPPPGQSIVNTEFSQYNVSDMLSHQTGIAKNFAWADAQIVSLFGQQLPLTSKREIASWLMTQPNVFNLGSQYGYANSNFVVLGAIIEKVRKEEWFATFQKLIMQPLGLTRSAVSGSLLSQRVHGEVLYHDTWLGLQPSIMTPDRPLAHDSYGNVNLSVGEAVGGMAMAPADYVRIMAALDLGKGTNNPLLHSNTVEKMWSYPNTIGQNSGWGNGWGGWQTSKGVQAWGIEGALANCHAVVEHRRDGYSLCVAFNTGQRDFWALPDWDDLIDSAPDWPSQDLFPSLGMASL